MKKQNIVTRGVWVSSASLSTEEQQAAISSIVDELRNRNITIDGVNKKTGEIEISLKVGVWVDSCRLTGMYHATAMVDEGELVTLVISPDAEIVVQVIEKYLKEVQE